MPVGVGIIVRGLCKSRKLSALKKEREKKSPSKLLKFIHILADYETHCIGQKIWKKANLFPAIGKNVGQIGLCGLGSTSSLSER